jgi:hypothetical protein
MTIELRPGTGETYVSVVPGARVASVYPKKMTTVTVKRQTLEATPRKVLVFLCAIGTNRSIRAAMEGMGYSRAENARGWALLLRVSGYEAPAGDEPLSDVEVLQAQDEIEAWAALKIELTDVTLKHRYPDQHAFVFDGLKREKGAETLLTVNTFLLRLDALEKGVGREETRAADLAALATLAQRGLTAEDRANMRKALSRARGFTPSEGEDTLTNAAADTRERDLYELRAFYEEWTGVARLALTRRDHLIRCGLAKRRVSVGDDAAEDSDDANDATPEGDGEVETTKTGDGATVTAAPAPEVSPQKPRVARVKKTARKSRARRTR